MYITRDGRTSETNNFNEQCVHITAADDYITKRGLIDDFKNQEGYEDDYDEAVIEFVDDKNLADAKNDDLFFLLCYAPEEPLSFDELLAIQSA